MFIPIEARSLVTGRAVWVRRHLYIVIVCSLGTALFVLSAYNYISESFQQRVTLLTGPEGSLNNDIGETLHDRFAQEPPWRFWGRSFELTPHETKGSQQNRWRVDEDRQGRLLGIALDGFSETPHVRTMLHLTDVPLLILATPSFLHRVAESNAQVLTPTSAAVDDLRADSLQPHKKVSDDRGLAGESQSFASIAEFVKLRNPCRFYLGEKGSGTRAMATRVLEWYGVSIDEVDRNSQMNFAQAAYSLEDNRVDVAFFLLPTETEFIVELLRHNGAQLVGLSQVEGFVKRYPFLLPETLATGLFGSNNPPRATATVNARVVLICSDSMPDNDAFWLTSSIAKYLSEDGGPSFAKDMTPDANGTWYTEHNGARMFREKGAPWYVIGSRNSIQWLLSALLLTPLAAYAPVWLGQLLKPRREQTVETVDAPAGTEFRKQPSSPEVNAVAPRELLRQAKKLCDDLVELPSHITASQLADVYNRFTELDRARELVPTITQSDHDAVEETRNVLKEVEENLNQMGVITPRTQDQSSRITRRRSKSKRSRK